MWKFYQNQLCTHCRNLPGNWKSTTRTRMRHSYHISQVRTSGTDRICSLNTVRNYHSVLQLQPLAATQPLSLLELKDAPQLSLWPVCSLSLSLWSGLSTVQDGKAVQHCHTRKRNAELLDISQGPGVENQFPFHHDLSLVPKVVSSTATSFLSHPYWVTSTPLLPLCSFICQPIHLTFFTQPRQNITPPTKWEIIFP